MLKILAVLGFSLAGGFVAVSGAVAQIVPKAPVTAVLPFEACPTAPPGELGATLSCRCDLTDLPGAVWGSGPYTNDSSICAAAVHAGLVPTVRGPNDTVRYVGDVALELVPGCEAYSGTEANGVTTRDYGSWRLSFYFPGIGSGVCAGVIGEAALCPSTMIAAAIDLTCTCTASDTQLGSVWGTGTYTDDSALCRAALHAGIVGAEGGLIHVIRTAGLKGYAASTQNGVESRSYGSWQNSISFSPTVPVTAVK